MKLPNGNCADLGDKVERYCLNSDHLKGKHKAKLFQKRLGITLENKELLKDALLEAAANKETTFKRADRFGEYFNTRFYMETSTGSSWVLACWIIRCKEDFPRLTNAYSVRQ